MPQRFDGMEDAWCWPCTSATTPAPPTPSRLHQLLLRVQQLLHAALHRVELALQRPELRLQLGNGLRIVLAARLCDGEVLALGSSTAEAEEHGSGHQQGGSRAAAWGSGAGRLVRGCLGSDDADE